jgi:hypothetical protein
MKILHKVMATGIMVSGECYVVGMELNDLTGDASLAVYNAAAATAAQLIATLRASDEAQAVNVMFPIPGIKCDNVYATLTNGAGTLYYYY